MAEPPPVDDTTRWAPLQLHREEVVTGRGEAVAVEPRLRSLLTRTSQGEAIYYGWPLVVAVDRTGRLRAAPLLMTELEPPDDGGSPVAVPRDDQPYLNPGLLGDQFFDPDALAAVDSAAAGGLPFGDARATRERVVDLCARLGLDGTRLDPDALSQGVRFDKGVHNTAVVFRGPSNRATRALTEELGVLATRNDWQRTAARWLMEPVAGTDSPTGEVLTDEAGALPELIAGLLPVSVEGLALNDSQEQALAAACTGPLTVVTGPPGTGKSQLVAAVVANQWVSGRTVLVASTNNGAVDVAARRCAALDPALLVRTGNRDHRDELPALLEALAARGATPGVSRDIMRRQLEVAAAGRDDVHRRLAERTRAEADLAQLVLDTEALRVLLWGDPRPSPTHDRRAEVHRVAVKAGRSRWWRAGRHRRMLAMAAPTVRGVTAEDVAAWAAAEDRLDALTARMEALGPADPERDRAHLARAEQTWAQAGTAALRETVQHRLHSGTAPLQQLARMRRAATSARVAAVARALPHVPGWACTTLSAHHTFPLTAGLFDLLVIDEASQCSIADVLPLAYRAKRILVVGDPNQLTPVVTLTKAALDGVAATAGTTQEDMHRHLLAAGRDSAYTAYAGRVRGRPHLLDEHYRSHPQIARFFNEQFYAGALRILTDVTTHTGTVRGLHLVDVRGTTRRGSTGGAYNADEAAAVITWVLAHLDEPGTLGIVTPFAAQAELIRHRLLAAIGPDVWTSKGVTVGTAHRFQGDERDIMLFSTVLATDARDGTARWVEEQRNLVNVAVSRARRALVVFTDVTALADIPVPTLHALVDVASGATPAVAAVDILTDIAALHSTAEQRLFAALAARGLTLRAKEVVEGYELDFALDTAAGPLNIEVDGTHHTDSRGRQRRQDLARDHILQGLGWTVLRIPAWQSLATPDTAASNIADVISRLGGTRRP